MPHLALTVLCLFFASVTASDIIGTAAAQTEEIESLTEEPGELPSERVIAIETTPAEDDAIRVRIEKIFAVLDGLDQIAIEVSSGVVRLSGDVGSKDARERALDLAARIEGVVEVLDDTSLDRDVERRLAPTVERIAGWGGDLVGYLPLLLIAILIVGVFWLLSRLSGGLSALYQRLTPNAFIARLLRQIVQGAVLLIGLVLALSVLDASGLVGTVLGAAGLLGLALSFALRDTVENYIASILLSLRQPFAPNDEVMIEGHEGRIIRLTSRATVLLTLEGNHIRIPNATVFKGVIVNYTRRPERRFDFTVGIDTAADLLSAQALAIDTLKAAEGVLDDPPPSSRVDELGDSSVVLWVAGWVDQRRHDHRKVKSEALRLVKEAFDEAEIDMPEPIYRLRFERDGAIQIPEGRGKPTPAASQQPRTARVTVDVSRDAEIDESIAEERADPDASDLLDPAAPKE